MKTPVLTGITLGLLAMASSLPAANIDNGKKLVSENCTKCHDQRVYTRPDHRVTTLDGLDKQVRRCQQSLGLKWFDDDIDDVAAYLNQTYYHFK
jgi:cytochrome c553